jgi:hypothetical protein
MGRPAVTAYHAKSSYKTFTGLLVKQLDQLPAIMVFKAGVPR